jgi:hypothetical protein
MCGQRDPGEESSWQSEKEGPHGLGISRAVLNGAEKEDGVCQGSHPDRKHAVGNRVGLPFESVSCCHNKLLELSKV